ncbi:MULTISPECIES: hypothetical protein [unclassified Paraburkholderia]|uniref:hypothetical protein n=1 Tax=unclassified Paraburkholderia TaxID=2615204 RepID=UPI001616392C|nr:MULTISPECIES: hypothetical protein [unclassified Paraburkholderia]MBB5447017.1 hypothetical protein [Paraburkholderia sp. WSM4177]MBB5487561.1 hypothetical protein [Paraburkholderia sp. WSM4180]
MNHAPVESRISTRNARTAAADHEDQSDDAHLSAYNAAFSELGLRFRWDRATFDMLKEFNGELARITAYIERYHSHLHRAYDADFLAQLILHRKTQYYSEFAATVGE